MVFCSPYSLIEKKKGRFCPPLSILLIIFSRRNNVKTNCSEGGGGGKEKFLLILTPTPNTKTISKGLKELGLLWKCAALKRFERQSFRDFWPPGTRNDLSLFPGKCNAQCNGYLIFSF